MEESLILAKTIFTLTVFDNGKGPSTVHFLKHAGRTINVDTLWVGPLCYQVLTMKNE